MNTERCGKCGGSGQIQLFEPVSRYDTNPDSDFVRPAGWVICALCEGDGMSPSRRATDGTMTELTASNTRSSLVNQIQEHAMTEDIGTTASSSCVDALAGDQKPEFVAHTPGPWTILPGHSCIQVLAGRKSVAVVGDAPYYTDYSPNDQADARLIAAAPDMLAALEDCAGQLMAAEKFAGLKFPDAIAAAAAAISKAKGE